MSGPRITLELPSVPESIPAARHELDRLADALPPAVLEDARLLMSELVTNAVRHAGLGPEGRISVRAELRSGRLRVEVRDQGGGFEPTRAPSAERGSGWGLYLVREIADRWGILRDHASCVWFEIDVASDGGGRGDR